jgi:hypothetical protein
MENVRVLESPESASPVITRAVASALLKRDFDVFDFPWWQKVGLAALSVFPARVARQVAQWNMALSALEPGMADCLSADDLVDERLNDYKDLTGDFEVVVVGAALGGAAAHLAVAMGAPFLPQPFILSFRGGSPDDEVGSHFELSKQLGDRILANNKGVVAIGHFDPIHDGWLTRKVNHLRLKLTDLPSGYRDFLRNRLRPGGSILYLDCGARWLQYALGPRHFYQIGGWGGIPAQEFFQGSERIDTALTAADSPHRGGWQLSGKMPEERAESEWGSMSGLDDALEAFAAERGFSFHRLRMPQPHDFSWLAFKAQEELCNRSGVRPQGVIIETFTQYDPSTALKGGLLPLWLIFNTYDSLEFLQRCRGAFPPEGRVFFSGLVTLSRTPDMVPWEGWARALEGLAWTNIGARPKRYPEDLAALWRWPMKLRAWVRDHPAPLTARLRVEDVLEIAAGL